MSLEHIYLDLRPRTCALLEPVVRQAAEDASLLEDQQIVVELTNLANDLRSRLQRYGA